MLLIVGGRLFIFGINKELYVFDLVIGTLLWSKNFVIELGVFFLLIWSMVKLGYGVILLFYKDIIIM